MGAGDARSRYRYEHASCRGDRFDDGRIQSAGATTDRAGASFLVSPGCTPRLLDALVEQKVPILPGAATASEVMALLENGITEMKFFPASAIGGAPALKALAGPLPEVTFCPTGGIDRAAAGDYLALPNVACAGGSWLTPVDLIAAQHWNAITARAADTQSVLR
jgi:2-dehydro-3-deoxyphosphogluconate aldolase / (4S)-4-hydroxy-2-oxoglutarate aldolase